MMIIGKHKAHLATTYSTVILWILITISEFADICHSFQFSQPRNYRNDMNHNMDSLTQQPGSSLRSVSAVSTMGDENVNKVDVNVMGKEKHKPGENNSHGMCTRTETFLYQLKEHDANR